MKPSGVPGALWCWDVSPAPGNRGLRDISLVCPYNEKTEEGKGGVGEGGDHVDR